MSEEKKTSSKTSKKRRKKNGRRNLIITIFVLVILAVCAALLLLGTGSISKWNKFRPRKASIQRVADYFGVELEFLIGNSKQNQEEVS